MIRAVLFDVGGTLHAVRRDPDRELHFYGTVLEVLASAGISLPVSPAALGEALRPNAEAYKRWSEEHRRELPGDQIWAEFYLKGFGVKREQVSPVAEELSFLYDAARVRNEPRPHLRETIRELKAMGLHLGVISNIISHTFVPRVLEDYSIAADMECVILSSEAGARKPDPAIFRLAAARVGVALEEMAYVGDTLSRDVLGCRRAGVGLCIQIHNPSIAHRDRDFLNTGLKPDFLIHDLAEIPGIVRTYNVTI